MGTNIIVVDADQDHSRQLCALLKKNRYSTISTHSIQYLETATRFLCTSKDRFHPELKDAICYHIYACLNKPVDPDEMVFWIKSIFDEENIPDL